ncbi:two-component regulator propeller domain-containing protein [Pseudoxanthomonas sp. X-1]|uniref:sensor histidine kinase n=1 Tax=Pseudoxanthomonas sp. X-1 TaxID=2571115 RepID=UPI00110B468C|nr:two-component regulator propeller domain-containing protein [Pseudoxanthomonas sp. X-1]TMN17585.1 response regulator [Pseudoxanthomonas sp. X-1]UAY75708.1 response regulator [Pseudoxanthomonas sp. X-1]
MWGRVIVLWSLLAWCGLAAARVPLTPQPRQMGVADGLPSATINAFAEDHLGYLWMASSDGLARYDGRGFRIWRMEHGLRDNQLWSLYVDAQNQLWIGTENEGIAVLDADRRDFRFYNRANTPQLRSNTIWCIAATPDGSLWFGTMAGGLTRRLPDGRFEHFRANPKDPRALPGRDVVHLALTPDGSLWVGTRSGLARWTGHDFERVPSSALPSPKINRLTVEADGSLWVATSRGVSLRKPDGKWVRDPWRPVSDIPILQTMLRDSAGTYWFDTAAGMGYKAADGTVRNVPLYSVSARGVVKPNWMGGYEDRDGGLWFASLNAGLWHLPANWRQFAVLTNDASDPSTMTNPYVLAQAPSRRGGLWLVGTRGALDWLDPASGRVEQHVQPLDPVNWPQSVEEDSQGRVWVGLSDKLLRYDPASGRRREWTLDDASDRPLPGGQAELRRCGAQLWISANSGGLQLRDEQGHVLRNLERGSDDYPTGLMVQQMRCDAAQRLWLATNQGVLTWDAARGRLAAVPGGPEQPLFSLALAGDGSVWTGRMGQLDHYAWNGQRLTRLQSIGLAQDFPAIAPTGMRIDARGVVWTTSSRGLARVDPVKGMVRTYSVRDGLPNPEVRPNTLVQAASGQLSMTTPDGLVLFDPARLVPSARRPDLQFEFVGVRRGDRGLDLTHTVNPLLDSEDRDLHVIARLLSFTGAEGTTYRYRLSGYDPGWVEVGNTGERIFSRLPPGRYALEVQGRSSDSVWSQVRTLRFRVAPPWWQSPWGVACMAGLLIVLIAWWMHAYRRRLRRRTEWQMAQHRRSVAEQASQAKTQFLATLGHEVRTPMTGVLGMSELLLATKLDERQHRYIRAIQNAGRHLLRLVNDALDLARIEAGRLELDQQDFDLRELLDEVVALTAPMAERRGLTFTSEIDPRLPAALRGDAVRVRQILLNLLGNAVKFTERGQVSLQARPLDGQGLRLVVSDTGPGINAEQQARLFQRFEQGDGAHTRYGGSGLGLAISQELAGAMGGGIAVESTPGQGTRFVVDLPLPAAQGDGAAGGVHAETAEGPLSVLLVEDDATIAEVIVGLLQARGHRVRAVPHGLAALAEATMAHFDIALLDLDLPGMDGLALARELRRQGFAPPLLAVTARTDAQAEVQAREAGFDGFLRKPVTGELLAAAMTAARAAANLRKD